MTLPRGPVYMDLHVALSWSPLCLPHQIKWPTALSIDVACCWCWCCCCCWCCCSCRCHLAQLTAGPRPRQTAIGSRQLTHFRSSALAAASASLLAQSIGLLFSCAFPFRIFAFIFFFLPSEIFSCFFFTIFISEKIESFSPDHNAKRKCKCSSWSWNGGTWGGGSQKGKAKQCQWGVWATCFRAKM